MNALIHTDQVNEGQSNGVICSSVALLEVAVSKALCRVLITVLEAEIQFCNAIAYFDVFLLVASIGLIHISIERRKYNGAYRFSAIINS